MAGQIPNCDHKSITTIYGPNQDRRALDTVLLHRFLDFAEPLLPNDVAPVYFALKKTTDLRYPHEWFPEARKMQR